MMALKFDDTAEQNVFLSKTNTPMAKVTTMQNTCYLPNLDATSGNKMPGDVVEGNGNCPGSLVYWNSLSRHQGGKLFSI
jgi:hypothetical protein